MESMKSISENEKNLENITNTENIFKEYFKERWRFETCVNRKVNVLNNEKKLKTRRKNVNWLASVNMIRHKNSNRGDKNLHILK